MNNTTKTLTNIIKSNNNQTKLWDQNKYDIGSWTKSKMMKIKQNKINLQQSTIIKTKYLIRKETIVNDIKDVPNPWKNIVDKVPNNLVHPIEIIPSTTSSLSSLTKNSIPNPKKKINNRVDTFIKSWENKLKETKSKIVNINSLDEFPTIKQSHISNSNNENTSNSSKQKDTVENCHQTVVIHHV